MEMVDGAVDIELQESARQPGAGPHGGGLAPVDSFATTSFATKARP
jgi:hypothetical protein